MEGGFYLSAVGCVAATGCGVVGAVQFGDIAIGVFGYAGAGDEIGVAEADFSAGGQAVELFRGALHKVIVLDVEFSGEGDFARTGGGVFGVVDGIEVFDFILGVIIDDDF